MLENFLNLPKEKQDRITDAALAAFAANGYKKTSVSDIAKASGTSKAAIFHYFGTKKVLYFYLIDLCVTLLKAEISGKFDSGVTDFFEKIKLAASIKVAVLKKHPAIFAFLNSMYFENDEEVKKKIKSLLANSQNYGYGFIADGVDASKFKDGIDPEAVLRMLVLLEEGVLSELPDLNEADIDQITSDFYKYMNLIKNNFYKDEF